MNPFRNSQALASVNDLAAQQANANAANCGAYHSAIPMTPAGAIEYAMRVRDKFEQENWDRRADIAILKRRVMLLERELAALKTPSDTNWSA